MAGRKMDSPVEAAWSGRWVEPVGWRRPDAADGMLRRRAAVLVARSALLAALLAASSARVFKLLTLSLQAVWTVTGIRWGMWPGSTEGGGFWDGAPAACCACHFSLRADPGAVPRALRRCRSSVGSSAAPGRVVYRAAASCSEQTLKNGWGAFVTQDCWSLGPGSCDVWEPCCGAGRAELGVRSCKAGGKRMACGKAVMAAGTGVGVQVLQRAGPGTNLGSCIVSRPMLEKEVRCLQGTRKV